jgi:uncharacterized protein YerC
MSNVVRSSFQAASRELIAKLVKAGYLQPALRHDADAVTAAIARLKHDLRSGGGEDESPLERLQQTSASVRDVGMETGAPGASVPLRSA